MRQPCLIAVDWGTSSFRAYLIDDKGGIADRRDVGRGILSVSDLDFAAVLRAETTTWRGDRSLPILMSGMIGSRQGWHEAAYAACPAGLDHIASRLLRFDADDLGDVAIVPGLSAEARGVPDVMRGEETQLIGAMALQGKSEGIFVLPGTHAKWARIEAGRIAGFATYMTGEVFAALKDHTILGRLMATLPDAVETEQAFERGVRAGAEAGGAGSLLHRIFSARTLGLFDRLPAEAIADYLSGLLIGAEIADAVGEATDVTIIATAALAIRYERAGLVLGIAMQRAPDDCAAAGLFEIARAANLIGSTS
jgi:2-dehydro-3-deoxygalactonokinase